MEMWNRCAICGKSIPVGELCYGIKNWHGEPTNGDTICSDCIAPENAPTLTPPNEPLTLDELRQMDGQPVWGKSMITGKPGEWFIVRIVEMSKSWFIACAGATQGFGDKDTYGMTWIAYRFPPEDRNGR